MRSNTGRPCFEDLIKSTYRSLLMPGVTQARVIGYKFPARRDEGIPVYEDIDDEIEHMAKLLPATTSDVNYARKHLKLVEKCTEYREARSQEHYHKAHGLQLQKAIVADLALLETHARHLVTINDDIVKHSVSIRKLADEIVVSDDDLGRVRMEREMRSMHEIQQGRSQACGKLMEKVYRVVNEANLKAAQLHICEMEHRVYAELASDFQKEAWVIAGHFNA